MSQDGMQEVVGSIPIISKKLNRSAHRVLRYFFAQKRNRLPERARRKCAEKTAGCGRQRPEGVGSIRSARERTRK